mmetsp:Transcript_6937/g.17505  ORF Transcript_6937/g.17505 Transcript_6937/m.17505 type:complete len:259 (-) Transcript_6937:254-1030(-)
MACAVVTQGGEAVEDRVDNDDVRDQAKVAFHAAHKVQRTPVVPRIHKRLHHNICGVEGGRQVQRVLGFHDELKHAVNVAAGCNPLQNAVETAVVWRDAVQLFLPEQQVDGLLQLVCLHVRLHQNGQRGGVGLAPIRLLHTFNKVRALVDVAILGKPAQHGAHRNQGGGHAQSLPHVIQQFARRRQLARPHKCLQHQVGGVFGGPHRAHADVLHHRHDSFQQHCIVGIAPCHSASQPVQQRVVVQLVGHHASAFLHSVH